MKRWGALLAIGVLFAPVSASAVQVKPTAKVYWCQRYPDELLRDSAGNLSAIRYFYVRFTQAGTAKTATMFEVVQTDKGKDVRTMEFRFSRVSAGNEIYAHTDVRGTSMEVCFVKNPPTDRFHPVQPGSYGDSCVVKARALGEHDLLSYFQRLVPADYPDIK